MSDDNMAKLLEQRSHLVERLIGLAAYEQYHKSINQAIKEIDLLIMALQEVGTDEKQSS